MTERLGNLNQPQEIAENLSTRKVLFVGSLCTAFYGATSYGIAELAGLRPSGEIAIGVGGSIGAGTAGIVISVETAKRAKELALQGKTIRSFLKTVQASIEAAVGLGGSGAIAGFEAAGVKGAITGAAVGTLIGGIGSFEGNMLIRNSALKDSRSNLSRVLRQKL